MDLQKRRKWSLDLIQMSFFLRKRTTFQQGASIVWRQCFATAAFGRHRSERYQSAYHFPCTSSFSVHFHHCRQRVQISCRHWLVLWTKLKLMPCTLLEEMAHCPGCSAIRNPCVCRQQLRMTLQAMTGIYTAHVPTLPLGIFPGGQECRALANLLPSMFGLLQRTDVTHYCESAMAVVNDLRRTVYPAKVQVVSEE